MAQALLAEPPAAAIDLRTSDARRRRETRMRWLFKAAAIFTFAISIAILYILIKDALSFFIDVPKASLWEHRVVPPARHVRSPHALLRQPDRRR